MLILPKRTSAPSTPSADKATLYLNSSELLAFVNDAGTVRELVGATSGTFTPALTFGGGATGMTFSNRAGRWKRLSNGLMWVNGFMALSAKGSSTGAAKITALPVAAEPTSFNFHPCHVRLNAMASISGYVQALLSPSATEIEIEHLGTGTSAALTHANFTDTSAIVFELWYEVTP